MTSSDPFIHRNVYIAASASKVWQAIVTPPLASRYFLCPLVKIDLEVGGEMFYGTPGQRYIDAYILELSPQEKLVHSFAMLLYIQDDIAYEPPTRVAYELFPMGDMCLLTLTHDGFNGRNQTYNDLSDAWDTMLSALKTVVETGRRLPWPQKQQYEVAWA